MDLDRGALAELDTGVGWKFIDVIDATYELPAFVISDCTSLGSFVFCAVIVVDHIKSSSKFAIVSQSLFPIVFATRTVWMTFTAEGGKLCSHVDSAAITPDT